MTYEEIKIESEQYRGKTPELTEEKINSILDKPIIIQSIPNDMCRDCKVKYDHIDQYRLVCPKCNGYAFVGDGAECSGSGSSTSKNDEDHVLTQLKACNDQMNGCIPLNIIHSAYQMFLSIKNKDAEKKTIWRGDVLRGILAACVSLKCQQAEIAKDDQFFCEMMNIKLTKITTGRTILLKNDVKIHRNTDPSASYIATYLEKLSMDVAKYQPVLMDILAYCKKTENIGFCKMQTPNKCIGAICVLCQILGTPLTYAQIIKCKKISKATYTNSIRKIMDLNVENIVKTSFPQNFSQISTT